MLKQLTRFTTGSRKALCARLELYYIHKLKNYNWWKDVQRPRLKETMANKIDRRFRVELKAIEIVLENLNSLLFQNEQKSSIRKTMHLKEKLPVSARKSS